MNRLGVDLDGCCANFLAVAVTLLKNPIDADRVLRLNDDSQEYLSLDKELMDISLTDIYGDLPLIPDSNYYLNLLKDKFKIDYISTRSTNFFGSTIDWLERYEFPSTQNLNLVKNKSDRINSLAIDIMIEDRLLEVHRLLENTDVDIILFNNPYNAYEFKTKRVTRLNSWEEIYNFLMGIK